MDDTVIRFENVRFSYNGEPVLVDVDLAVTRGDFLAMVGPNGGGKTTLLRLILGLLTPESGRITVFGERPSAAASRIGYIQQENAANAGMPVSVMDVALMGRLRRGMIRYSRPDREAARRALETVGMDGARNRPFGSLSGGQRQRVLLARALAVDPEILLLDEPTAHLDPEAHASIYRILSDMADRLTVIVVGHDILDLIGHARTIVYVDRTVHTHVSPELDPEAYRDVPMEQLERICPVELMNRILRKREAEGSRS